MTISPRLARSRSLTSVTRWLLVVIGCAVLATAQPMSAAADEKTPAAPPASVEASKAAPPRGPEEIIHPSKSADTRVLQPSTRSGSGSLALVVALLLAAGGAWVLVQRRQGGPLANRSEKKLHVAETRPLGNRQYLVVADYEGQRFLLGVTPGQIQMLTPLKGSATEEKKS